MTVNSPSDEQMVDAIISSLMMGGEEDAVMLFSRYLTLHLETAIIAHFCAKVYARERELSRNECCKNNVYCCCVTLSNQMQISLC